MDHRMRQRGWSINSDGDTGTNQDPSWRIETRDRQPSMTDQSEDTFTAAEKTELLNSYPIDDEEGEEKDKVCRISDPSTSQNSNTRDVATAAEADEYRRDNDVINVSMSSQKEAPRAFGRSNSAENEKSDGDIVSMFGDIDSADEGAENDDDDNPAARKRRKTGRLSLDGTTHLQSSQSNEGATSANLDVDLKESVLRKRKELSLAKSKLSKWAARLFDPDRPRGLIEGPMSIPLNDEFLKEFGKREKEFDARVGRILDIDNSNLDEAPKSSEELSKGNAAANVHIGDTVEDSKVKINNLAYTTTQATLTTACEVFGALIEVNLVTDPNRNNQSTGRAYVTFESSEAAKSCIQEMNEKQLDGRILRIALAVDKPKKGSSPHTNNVSSKGGTVLARYWEKDISTKCFRCGEVGHMEASCMNKERPKPCTLCAKTGHDSWSCSYSRICFNCGTPGHVSRDCPERRGMAKRTVCGLCLRSGHHRWCCREDSSRIPTRDAVCLVCHKSGHFMCTPMRWFYGLKGIFCFNCGQHDHHGMNCNHPQLDVCAKDADIALKEIDRAETFSLVDELSSLKQTRNNAHYDRAERQLQDEGLSRNQSDKEERPDHQRSKNYLPQEAFRAQNQASIYGRIDVQEMRNRNSNIMTPTSPLSKRGRSDEGYNRNHSNGRGRSDERYNRNHSNGRGRSDEGYNRNHSNGRGYRDSSIEPHRGYRNASSRDQKRSNS